MGIKQEALIDTNEKQCSRQGAGVYIKNEYKQVFPCSVGLDVGKNALDERSSRLVAEKVPDLLRLKRAIK
jgi:hypothetical protein